MHRSAPPLRRFLPPALVALALASALGAAAALGAGDDTDLYFDSDGVEIHYRVWGQGDPIVLIHGFTASIENNWVQPGVVAALSPDFKVIALDLRGHGKSEKPHDPTAYGAEMAEDVVRLLDHLGVEKAHVVGYSLGGFTTLKLATLHPERLLSATLGGAGWRPPGEDGGVAGLAESLEAGDGIGPLMRALTPAGQPTPSPEQLEMVNRMLMATNDPLALAAVARGMGSLAVPEETARTIEVPMLAVVGEIDPLRAGVDELRRLLPGLEVVVLPRRDHITAFADPAFSSAIHDFLVRLCQCA